MRSTPSSKSRSPFIYKKAAAQRCGFFYPPLCKNTKNLKTNQLRTQHAQNSREYCCKIAQNLREYPSKLAQNLRECEQRRIRPSDKPSSINRKLEGKLRAVGERNSELRAKDSSRWWSGVAAQPPAQYKKEIEPGSTWMIESKRSHQRRSVGRQIRAKPEATFRASTARIFYL